MKKILITGSTGLVGSRIVELLQNDFEFIPLFQKQLDITNKKEVDSFISQTDFDLLLHLAAYTNVDKAEIEKQTAFTINSNGTQYLHEAVKNKGKEFVFISTDFVFDGKNPPYDESSTPSPISVYGQSKYEGEQTCTDAMIVRISYPYRREFAQKKDFVRGIISALQQGKTLFMVKNSFITPTLIDDIAFSLRFLMNHYSTEIFHVVGTTSLSPYDAGLQIAKLFRLNKSQIQPIQYNKYFESRAKRPQFSKIISKKNTFHTMKSFEDGLKSIISS